MWLHRPSDMVDQVSKRKVPDEPKKVIKPSNIITKITLFTLWFLRSVFSSGVIILCLFPFYPLQCITYFSTLLRFWDGVKYRCDFSRRTQKNQTYVFLSKSVHVYTVGDGLPEGPPLWRVSQDSEKHESAPLVLSYSCLKSSLNVFTPQLGLCVCL